MYGKSHALILSYSYSGRPHGGLEVDLRQFIAGRPTFYKVDHVVEISMIVSCSRDYSTYLYRGQKARLTRIRRLPLRLSLGSNNHEPHSQTSHILHALPRRIEISAQIILRRSATVTSIMRCASMSDTSSSAQSIKKHIQLRT